MPRLENSKSQQGTQKPRLWDRLWPVRLFLIYWWALIPLFAHDDANCRVTWHTILHPQFCNALLTNAGARSIGVLDLWELAALMTVLFMTIDLWFSAPEKKGLRTLTIVLAGAAFVVALAAVCFLFAQRLREHFLAYRLLLILVFILYMLGDILMAKKLVRKAADRQQFHELIYVVDIPVLAGVVLLVGYVWFNQPVADEPFFSGALALQLILANIIVGLIRLPRLRARMYDWLRPVEGR